jgi:hypothetical protein
MHRFSFAGTYRRRVFGLYAAGVQFFPPQREGQNVAIPPVEGFLESSYSGRPVARSIFVKTS